MTYWGVLVSWEGSNINQTILKELFEPYQAVDVTIDQVRPDNNNRTAFVKFMTQQAAEYAQDQTDGLVLGDTFLEVFVEQRNLPIPIPQVKQPPIPYVEPNSIPNSQQDQLSQVHQEILDKKILFIKNLNPITTEDDIKAIFSDYNCINCTFVKRHYSGKTHNCYVDFMSEEDASRALQYSNGMKVNENIISVEYQREKSQSPHNRISPQPSLDDQHHIQPSPSHPVVLQQTSSIQPPPPPNLMNNNNINQNPVDKRILLVQNINPLTTEENFRNAFAP
ncbi:MAG: hypothetical protein EZS28_013679, partial [Streblomastix strix]